MLSWVWTWLPKVMPLLFEPYELAAADAETANRSSATACFRCSAQRCARADAPAGAIGFQAPQPASRPPTVATTAHGRPAGSRERGIAEAAWPTNGMTCVDGTEADGSIEIVKFLTVSTSSGALKGMPSQDEPVLERAPVPRRTGRLSLCRHGGQHLLRPDVDSCLPSDSGTACSGRHADRTDTRNTPNELGGRPPSDAPRAIRRGRPRRPEWPDRRHRPGREGTLHRA